MNRAEKDIIKENFYDNSKGRAQKLDIIKENFYDNYKGSALLFEATAGSLRTKCLVRKYTQSDGVCVVRGKEKEIIGTYYWNVNALMQTYEREILY